MINFEIGLIYNIADMKQVAMQKTDALLKCVGRPLY